MLKRFCEICGKLIYCVGKDPKETDNNSLHYYQATLREQLVYPYKNKATEAVVRGIDVCTNCLDTFKEKLDEIWPK